MKLKDKDNSISSLSGLAIGFLSGLVGIGGGEYRAPVLIYLLRLKTKFAIASNLLIGLLVVSTSFIRRLDSSFTSNILVIQITMAAPVETATTITSNVGAIQSGESVNFIIHVYSGYDPVPTGSVRLTDTYDNEQYVDGVIVNGVCIIEWTPDEFVEGDHIFEAVFQGYLDYSASSGECTVIFDLVDLICARENKSRSTFTFSNPSISAVVSLNRSISLGTSTFPTSASI